jgi:A/G-specific adenine glycosylase
MRPRHKWSSTEIKRFQRRILHWYDKNKRIVPWRVNPTPYRVWVSEIMLQQTQAKTVIPYFDRFIRQLPDLDALARAKESKVLELWAGLGYYGRARNLHKAARQMVKEYGSFPREFKAILALPGVGRYTAGAICSLAFNQRQPIVDGNVRRLLIRLNGIKKHAAESQHWYQMSALLPETSVSSFNQAMMELGAMVCVPFRPQCHQCPVRAFCGAYRLGIQNGIPVAQPKQIPQYIEIVILMLEKSGKILLTSGKKPSFIPGDWGLPCKSISNGEVAAETASLLCSRLLGRAIPLYPLIPIRHSITRYRICANGFRGEVNGSNGNPEIADRIRWVPRVSLKKFLISSLFQKVFTAYARTG